MLPIFPQSNESPPPRSPPPWQVSPVAMILVFYCIGGAISGMVAGALAGGGYIAISRLEDFVRPPAPIDEWGFRWVPSPSQELVGSAAMGSACNGPTCAVVLWIITAYFRSMRHPVRAASLCGSLAGTVGLLMVACVDFDWRGERVARLLAVPLLAVVGAVFGFGTTLLARLMERGWERTIMRSE